MEFEIAKHPQHLLLTLLGDYWYNRTETVASNAFVALLQHFGVSEPNGRAALSRLARRGLIESIRIGRSTRYRLTAKGVQTLHEGTKRIFTFGANEDARADLWTCLTFSIPETERSKRHRLRTQLQWLGFAALYDGVWFAPGDQRDRAQNILSSLDVEKATLLIGQAATGGVGDPVKAWDLASLRASYDTFIDEFTDAYRASEAGEITEQKALVVRTAIIDVWRTFPAMDPELPTAALPSDWPQQRALRLFQNVYDALGPLAIEQVRRIIADYDIEAAELVQYHTCYEATDTTKASNRKP